MDIPGLSGRLLFKHLLQLWISRGCLGKLQTPSTALDIPGLSTETSHTFYSSGYPRVVYGNFTHLLQLWISRGCLRKLHTPSTARLWISRGCLGDSSSNTFYSYGYPGVVWETPLQTPSTAMDIPGLSGRLLFKHLLQLWISRGYLGKLQTPSTALDIPGLSTETSHTFYSSGYPGLIYGNFTHLLQLWISRGCLGDSSSNTFYSYEYPGVVWETPLQTPSTALDIPGLSRETSDTFYSSGYPGVIYGNFTHLLQLWISRGCLRKLHTPSTARVGWSAVVIPGQRDGAQGDILQVSTRSQLTLSSGGRGWITVSHTIPRKRIVR
ncbi:hypothetical protein J6590_084866 [Homalodisca vitripennis]|nr:hypothetical protein J6590_084866 [Homalodisca vitripennis]